MTASFVSFSFPFFPLLGRWRSGFLTGDPSSACVYQSKSVVCFFLLTHLLYPFSYSMSLHARLRKRRQARRGRRKLERIGRKAIVPATRASPSCRRFYRPWVLLDVQSILPSYGIRNIGRPRINQGMTGSSSRSLLPPRSSHLNTM